MGSQVSQKKKMCLVQGKSLYSFLNLKLIWLFSFITGFSRRAAKPNGCSPGDGADRARRQEWKETKKVAEALLSTSTVRLSQFLGEKLIPAVPLPQSSCERITTSLSKKPISCSSPVPLEMKLQVCSGTCWDRRLRFHQLRISYRR